MRMCARYLDQSLLQKYDCPRLTVLRRMHDWYISRRRTLIHIMLQWFIRLHQLSCDFINSPVDHRLSCDFISPPFLAPVMAQASLPTFTISYGELCRTRSSTDSTITWWQQKKLLPTVRECVCVVQICELLVEQSTLKEDVFIAQEKGVRNKCLSGKGRTPT